MINVAIVEDEEVFCKELLDYLKQYQEEEGETYNITVYKDGDELVKEYKQQFDLILMDIMMRFMNGMEAAEEIRKVDQQVVIMFITNMTQFAIKGYEVDALDYILKPLTYFAFSQKFKRAINRIKSRSEKYIVISNKSETVRMALEDVHYIESVGHNLIYHTYSGNYTVSGTMKETENELEPYGFARGNHCNLINLKYVANIKDKCAIVKGKPLQLSRSRQKEFMQKLTNYWGEEK